ncbi:MAG: hypothetical protein HOP95_10850 [Sphingomonas sp.]|nr:hypothetical protein [Sphingomonas sp.]
MNLLCRFLGHRLHGRQMDANFKEYSHCSRCSSALEREAGGKWRRADAPRSAARTISRSDAPVPPSKR